MADHIKRLTVDVRAEGTGASSAPTGVAVGRHVRFKHAIIAGAALGIVILGALVWLWQIPASVPPVASTSVKSTPRLFTVAAEPLTSHLTIVGTIGAGKSIPVMASFDGTILEVRAQLGDRVAVGDVLVVMDAGEVRSRLRDAQSALLKATMASEALKHWDTSPDVMRAKRTLESAEASLATLERQVSETKALFDRGIISRNEYDGLVQQRDAQRITVEGNRQDFRATLDRGSAANSHLAELDLANATARLTDVQQQVNAEKIIATTAGILIRPPMVSQSTQGPPSVDPGARVQRGQALYAIADTTKLVVTGKVDEVDVNQIRVGQMVTITSDALPGEAISGRVASISAEASSDQAARVPSFDIRAEFSQGQDHQPQQIRLGMSAHMTIETYSNPAAIVVPVEAIRRSTAAPTVRLRDRQTREELDQPVTLGATTEGGVEILKGLNAGEQIILP